MRTKVIAGTAVTTFVVAISWLAIEMNNWENRCERAGGHVVSEYIGQVDIPIYGDKGQITGWVHNPIYNYHCMNDRNEPIKL